MTESAMRKVIARECERLGGMRAFARQHGCAVSYLSDVLSGRRAPGPAILKPLGYRRQRITTYIKTPA